MSESRIPIIPLSSMNVPNSSTGESHSARPLPPVIVPQKRRFSSSMRGSAASPRRPSLPPSPQSPRNRHSYSTENTSDKYMNLSEERVKEILKTLETNDACDATYRRTDNCLIFPGNVKFAEVNDKSYNEQKFMKREFPSFISTEAQIFKYLMTQFHDAMKGVENRFPNYYSTSNLDDYQLNGMISEADMWFTLFDECINQESKHSQINAYVMQNVLETFQQDFAILVMELKNERQKMRELTRFYEKNGDSSEFTALAKTIENLKADKERLTKEIKKMEEEVKNLHIRNFNLQREIDLSKSTINELLHTTDELRQNIAAGNRRIYEMEKEKPKQALEASFTAVPKEIMETWTQCCQFLTAILEDGLLKLDLNQIYPRDIKDDTLGTFLKIERPTVPTYEGENIHFSKLFHLIKTFKGEAQPNQIFTMLENKIRSFFKKFALFYVERTKGLKQANKDNETRLRKQLVDLKRTMPCQSEWIANFLSFPELYVIPKKGVPDIQEQMIYIFQQSDTLMKALNKPNSASELLTKAYEGHDLLLFLAQVAKMSKTNILYDLLKQFLGEELPFHMFLFYCKFSLQNDKSDLMKRGKYLQATFNNYGWNSIPQLRKKSYETMFCPNPVNFAIFCLALYQHTIENIAMKISNEVNQKDLVESLMQKYNDKDLCDYLIAISEKNNPTIIKYAVILFNKSEKFEKLLSDFDPQQSKLIEYLNNFGKKEEKVKSPKKSRSQSRTKSPRSASKNKAPMPEQPTGENNAPQDGEQITYSNIETNIQENEGEEPEINIQVDPNGEA